jgi:hypothetical protein
VSAVWPARQGFWEGVADRLIRSVPRESFAGEGRSGAVAQQAFEAGAIRRFDAHDGVQREPATVVPAGEIGGDLRGEGAMAHRRAQHPAADPSMHRAYCGRVEIASGVEAHRTVSIEAEQAVGDDAHGPDGVIVETRDRMKVQRARGIDGAAPTRSRAVRCAARGRTAPGRGAGRTEGASGR